MTSNSGTFIAAPDLPRIDHRAAEWSRRAWHRVAEATRVTRLVSCPPSCLRGDLGLEPLGGLHDWRGPGLS